MAFSSVVNFLMADGLLTDRQLERLRAHKYKSSGSTMIESTAPAKTLFAHVAEMYPQWLAPNVLTITGLLANLVGCLVMARYSPDANHEAPRWVYIFCAVTLFIYQLMDETDGMHARATGSSSPVGELLDHGCDSLSQVFICLELCMCLKVGEWPGVVIALYILAMGTFYIAHWQAIDAAEGEILIMGFLVVTSLFGAGIWSIKVFRLPLKVFIVGFSIAVVAFNSIVYLKTTFTKGAGKDGSTVADTSIIFPVIPLSTIILSPIILYRLSASNVLREHVVLFCAANGMIASKRIMTIIVAKMTFSGLEAWDSVLWGAVGMIINYMLRSPIPEHVALHLFLIYGSINLGCYMWTMLHQMCDAFHIELFRISTNAVQNAQG